MKYGHEFTCAKCGGHEFYTDPASGRKNVAEQRSRNATTRQDIVGERHCIPCENQREDRKRAAKARWERKRPKRDRTAYRKQYWEDHRR